MFTFYITIKVLKEKKVDNKTSSADNLQQYATFFIKGSLSFMKFNFVLNFHSKYRQKHNIANINF